MSNRPIADGEARRLSKRADRCEEKMRCASTQGRRNLYARAWTRTVDRICDYKRQRKLAGEVTP